MCVSSVHGKAKRERSGSGRTNHRRVSRYVIPLCLLLGDVLVLTPATPSWIMCVRRRRFISLFVNCKLFPTPPVVFEPWVQAVTDFAVPG